MPGERLDEFYSGRIENYAKKNPSWFFFGMDAVRKLTWFAR